MATALKPPTYYLDDYQEVVVFQSRGGQNRDSLYRQICRFYDKHPKIEQDEKGNVYLMPTSGGESDNQDLMAGAQFAIWALRKGHGEAFGPATTFVFPNGAKRTLDLRPIWKGLRQEGE